MGTVYEATHCDLGKRVAIKTLHPHFALSRDLRARFLREGQAASRIRHPSVVDVYDVGTECGTPYLVMEYLDGEDLGKLIGRDGAIPVQEAVDLLLPVVGAVAAAHELGVIHRDLKPENVFMCSQRGATVAKVVDFGISKIVDQKSHVVTGTAVIMGTPYYMSPEQARGLKTIDASSDQYALGVILYECLTGRRPFEEPSLYDLMHKIVEGNYVPPSTRNPSVPLALEQVLARAMAVTSSHRFPTTCAFGRALLPFASERAKALFEQEFGVTASEAVAPQQVTPEKATIVGAPPPLARGQASSLIVGTVSSSGLKTSRFKSALPLLAVSLLAVVAFVLWRDLRLQAGSAAAPVRGVAAAGATTSVAPGATPGDASKADVHATSTDAIPSPATTPSSATTPSASVKPPPPPPPRITMSKPIGPALPKLAPR